VNFSPTDEQPLIQRTARDASDRLLAPPRAAARDATCEIQKYVLQDQRQPQRQAPAASDAMLRDRRDT
jgi:hypothetical protein